MLRGDEIANADKAAGEGELEVAANGVLLSEADEEEADELDGSPEEDRAAVVEAGVEERKWRLCRARMRSGEEDDAPDGADEEAAEGVGAAEAEEGELAVLDARHEPADEERGGRTMEASAKIMGAICSGWPGTGA